MSLEVKIKKEFPTFTLDVDFKAGKETLGFLGASGCGKSLTLRCIAGIETPDEGRIVVNGKVFYDSEARINLSPQERKTALLFQNYMLFPNLTVEKNIAAGIGKDVGNEERKKIIQTELNRFGLDGFEKRYPAQLSGGQQQRVALARMLAARPGILMLDEPMSALDAHLKGVLEQNLVGVFDTYDGTILYVSHDIDEALRFCDRIAVVEAGHILEIDSGDELVNDPHSGAAIKLSGCKNSPKAEFVDEHTVHIPAWGIDLKCKKQVPKDVKYVGIRGMHIHKAEGPGMNNFYVRVNRMSNARFDSAVMLEFVDNEVEDEQEVQQMGDIGLLEHLLFWRIKKDTREHRKLRPGHDLWINIPDDEIYIASK